MKKWLSADEILTRFRQKTIDPDWSFEGCTPSQTGKWTHDYHRYPAKFIPQLVEKLMEEYLQSSDAHINDPFFGSGTTIVTAIAQGMKASGTDINKIAYLMTRVKATPLEPALLSEQIAVLLDQLAVLESPSWDKTRPAIEPLIPVRHRDRIDYWFPIAQQQELGIILRMIDQITRPDIRNFFLVAFSHILKNCSIWLQTSTKPTRDLSKKPERPLTAFKRQISKMERGNTEFYQIVPATVKDHIEQYLNIKIGDARQQPVPNDSVDLIVSSSPYVTSYEYADLHQLSTIWLEFADDLSEYKREFIGTAHKAYPDRQLKSQIGQRIVELMNSRNKKMAKEIAAFFSDMQQVFDESYRILKHGGRCCFVIGDTRLKRVEILNAEVFAESLQYAGFTLDRIIKRAIPSKILPQKRDETTGRFASVSSANSEAYPCEFIVIGLKE